MTKAWNVFWFLAAIAASGCQPLGRGTTGANPYEIGMGREDGTLYPLGRTGPFEHSGLPDVNVAASRADAGLDVSGSGGGELARRSAAAAIQPSGPNSGLRSGPPSEADAILLDRVRLALSSSTPEQAARPALSIQTLHNVQLNADNRILTVGGEVASVDEKREVLEIVRAVPGVREVRDQLAVVPPAPATAPDGAHR
jgi:hypothetical protein